MSSSEIVQRAIQMARAGHRTEARDLLLKVVETEPGNETAWMWLSGLVDSLEDRIIACENALAINPANDKVRAYLAELHRRQNALFIRRNAQDAAELLQQAKVYAERNEIDSALQVARQAVEKDANFEEGWMFLGRFSPNVDQRIEALQKVIGLNPSRLEAASALQQATFLKANPIHGAVQLEQLGKFEEALQAYKELAGKTRNSAEFDHIYKQIIRIEGLRKENIRYVAPGSSIRRLTFVWPLLYLSLGLVQAGLNPFARSAFYLWLGLPWVIAGSFLLSVAEVRSNHVIWQKFFSEQGDGSVFARLVTAATGWFFVLIPHILIILDSLNRLQTLKIPPMPF